MTLNDNQPAAKEPASTNYSARPADRPRAVGEVSVKPPAGFHDPIRLRQAAAAGVALLLLVSLAGCSRREPGELVVYRVTGQVALGGKAAVGATVVLHDKSGRKDVPSPRALTDRQGNFELTTYRAGDGAPEGQYIVTVEMHSLVRHEGEYLPGPSAVPPQYTSSKTSNIAFDVIAGENRLPINIVPGPTREEARVTSNTPGGRKGA